MKFSWDDLGQLGRRVADTISDAADTVGKKTGEVVEVQKIKSQIVVLERENEKDFLDMGKMIFEKYKNGETVDPAFAAFCEEIENRLAAIKEGERKIVEIRGNGFCKECQTPLAKGMAYCPTCGAKVDTENDDIYEEEDIFDQEAVFEEETVDETNEADGADRPDAADAAKPEAEALKEAVTEAVTAEEEAAGEKPDSEESLADQVDSLEGKEGEV